VTLRTSDASTTATVLEDKITIDKGDRGPHANALAKPTRARRRAEGTPSLPS
jgi:hypothetical protein